MALSNQPIPGAQGAVARVNLLSDYYLYILLYEWGGAVAAGDPVGPIIPPGPTPATYRNWGAGAHAGGIATSRSQYLNYRFVDWQGTPSRGICEAGGLLAAAIGRTGSVFASGGPFVARRVVRRLFRYEAESIHPGQVAAYDAAYGQIDPNQSRSWRNYRDLFRNFWADTGTAPYLYMLTVIQPWTLAGYGVALPNPF